MISPSDAERLRASGLSVLPASKERKRPVIGGWKQYQTRIASGGEAAAWFAAPQDALCIVCGRVSGNLECLDFDSGGEAFPAFQSLVPPELGMRLVCENTQSGGVHVFYRVDSPVDGNQKLAMTEDGRVLVETRGEGGLVLVAPSDGYSLFQGDFCSLPVLSHAERDRLVGFARSLDRHAVPAAPAPEPQRVPAPAAPSPAVAWDLRPGEDYDARGDLPALLEAHGWTRVGGAPGNEGWKRPGKDGNGQSATWNGSVFYVFSSNAEPFEPNKGYGKFGVFAALECGGDFRAANDLLASRGYGRPAAPVTGVDFSSVVEEAERAASVPAAGPVPEPEAAAPSGQDPFPSRIPWELYSMPGFVDDLASYTMRVSPYTNRALAFSGALALLSFLCGRVYVSATGLSPLLYVLALAGSAVGKEAPRAVNKAVLATVGMAGCLGEEFASGEGLEDSLLESPSMLYQSDEIAFLFENLKEENPRARSVATKLLRLYSSSSGIYSTRVTSRKRATAGSAGERAAPRIVVRPCPVVYGSATPEKFYAALTRDLLENGLVGRCLVLEANAPRVRNRTAAPEDLPTSVLNAVEDLRRVAEEIGDGPARPVGETEDASRALSEFADECDDAVNRANAGGSDGVPGSAALWGRAWEKAGKLALLRAVSRAPGAPCVSLADASASVALARAVTSALLAQLRYNLAGTPFERSCATALRFLRRNPGGVSRTDLSCALRLPKRALDEVVGFLLESGQVLQGKVRNPNGANRSSICYRLAADRPPEKKQQQ